VGLEDLVDRVGQLTPPPVFNAVDLAAGKGKQTYVVEFWATWCGPCRVSIPHLTELQKKFKTQGVTFIGVSDETEDKVKPFVDKMGDKMDYTVAVDDERRADDSLDLFAVHVFRAECAVGLEGLFALVAQQHERQVARALPNAVEQDLLHAKTVLEGLKAK
jgi:thiol-disulfide isomerase/thioredoxin